MSGFCPVLARQNTPPATDLHGFCTQNRHVPPLASLYKGPLKVLFCSLRTFCLQVENRTETVSVQYPNPTISATDETPVLPPQCGCPACLCLGLCLLSLDLVQRL